MSTLLYAVDVRWHFPDREQGTDPGVDLRVDNTEPAARIDCRGTGHQGQDQSAFSQGGRPASLSLLVHDRQSSPGVPTR